MEYHPHGMYLVLVDARGLWRATYFAKQAAWETRISFYSMERAVPTVLFCLNERRPNPMVLTAHAETLMGSYEGARDMLVHEMCHLHVRAVQGDKGRVSHSLAWLELAERLGVYVSEDERNEAK